MKFNVGDRVQKINREFAGEFGKVVFYNSKIDSYLIEFEKSKGGMHDGGGMCKNHHGWWCNPNNLRLVDTADVTKIEIFRNGKAVIAIKRTNGKIVSKGVAKCHPDDEFDFDIGARLAMERCVGKAAEESTDKPVSNVKIVKQDRYEIGDKVKIVDEWVSGAQNMLGKMDKWLGKVMTIRRVDSMCNYKMEEDADENGSGWFWFIDDIEGKVVEDTEPESNPTESEPEFKVGDTVEFRDEYAHRIMPIFYPPVGTKGTVVTPRTDAGSVQVQWEEGSTYDDDCWYTLPDYVRKVSAEPTHKFKVGDIVIGNKLATARYVTTQKGWIGRVTEVSDKYFRAVPRDEDWMSEGFHLQYDYFDKLTVDKN